MLMALFVSYKITPSNQHYAQITRNICSASLLGYKTIAKTICNHNYSTVVHITAQFAMIACFFLVDILCKYRLYFSAFCEKLRSGKNSGFRLNSGIFRKTQVLKLQKHTSTAKMRVKISGTPIMTY